MFWPHHWRPSSALQFGTSNWYASTVLWQLVKSMSVACHNTEDVLQYWAITSALCASIRPWPDSPVHNQNNISRVDTRHESLRYQYNSIYYLTTSTKHAGKMWTKRIQRQTRKRVSPHQAVYSHTQKSVIWMYVFQLWISWASICVTSTRLIFVRVRVTEFVIWIYIC